MTDDVLAEQVDYYRQRAAEYDATSHGDLATARLRIDRLVGELRPRGRVLEIACGTGLWTEALARSADAVTAIDSSPEALAIARGRVPSAGVTFVEADVFAWRPDTAYDVVFFAFWLSHVPEARSAEFWDRLAGLLTADGRVLFVDEHVDERPKEVYVEDGDELVERKLSNGNTFRIVKNFVDPTAMEAELARLGWVGPVRRDGADWAIGEVRPRRAPLT